MVHSFKDTVTSMAGLTTARGEQHPWWAVAAGVQALMNSKKAEDVAAVARIEKVYTEVMGRK